MANLKQVDVSNDCPVVGCERKKSKSGLCKKHTVDLENGVPMKHYLGGQIVKKKEVHHG